MDELTDQPPPAVGTTDSREPPEPRVGEDGAPIYDQQFFLALARCGKDVWNEWRARHSGDDDDQNYIKVTFASVDFSAAENSDIDFSGFDFGHRPNLSGATFGDKAKLPGATFGNGANLSGATFGNRANLIGATFGDDANLSDATFGDFATLPGATFGDDANLSDATFGDEAGLSGATFGNWADLRGATFGDGADLFRATFGPYAELKGWSSEELTRFRGALVEDRLSSAWTKDRRAAFLKATEVGAARPDRFSSIYFVSARFLGEVDFSGRSFDIIANFRLARFDAPPRFDTLVNVGFYGAKIKFRSRVPGWTTNTNVATQLHGLRRLADEAKNYDLERNLYIEERRAERGIYFGTYLRGGLRNVGQRWRAMRPTASGATSGRVTWSSFRGASKPGERITLRTVAAFPFHVGQQVMSTTTSLVVLCAWIAVMWFYSLLADYGRSFIRPLFALVLSIVLFNAAYLFVLRPQVAPDVWPRVTAAIKQAITWPQANDPPFVRATRAFAVANAVPFVGALTLDKEVKERLICGDQPCVPIPPLRFQALALLQTIFSSVCVFFIALALRNYFRVK